MNGVEIPAELTFLYEPERLAKIGADPGDCYPGEDETLELMSLMTECGQDCTWMITLIGANLVDQIKMDEC